MAKTSRAGYVGAFQNVSGPLRPHMPPQSGRNGAVTRFCIAGRYVDRVKTKGRQNAGKGA